MEEKKTRRPSCASCDLDLLNRICVLESGEGGKGSPSLTRPEVLKKANERYNDPAVREFARQASIQEADRAL